MRLRDYLRTRRHTDRDLLSGTAASSAGLRRSGLWRGCISRKRKKASQQVLALPIFPQMTEEQQKMVVRTIARLFQSERPSSVPSTLGDTYLFIHEPGYQQDPLSFFKGNSSAKYNVLRE